MVGRSGAITRFYWFLEPRKVAHEVLCVQQFSCLEKAGGRAGGEGAVFAGGVSHRQSEESRVSHSRGGIPSPPLVQDFRLPLQVR